MSFVQLASTINNDNENCIVINGKEYHTDLSIHSTKRDPYTKVISMGIGSPDNTVYEWLDGNPINLQIKDKTTNSTFNVKGIINHYDIFRDSKIKVLFDVTSIQ